MINKEIFKIAGQLENVVKQQQKQAKDALEQIPDEAIRSKLQKLMRSAISGKLNPEDAQREIQKIIQDAGTN